VSRARNQTKETRIERCGFTGLTPVPLSADDRSLIAFSRASSAGLHAVHWGHVRI